LASIPAMQTIKKVRSELLRIQCYGVLECRNSFFRMTREI
jgi:hypothetical protein